LFCIILAIKKKLSALAQAVVLPGRASGFLFCCPGSQLEIPPDPAA